MVAPEGLLFLTLLFRFRRAEEFVFGVAVGVVLAAADMALLTVAVLVPAGVDMVVLGGVVVCYVQPFKLGCGNFRRLDSWAGTGGFGEAGGVTWPLYRW